ncbi:hypothetical protein Mtc_0342 [Methanocella conradii HZ254]|uniref:Uncharacterized protein n=1 Tax=Methanocella conradii (strain DSM 24694 / JCM 17849 / CGMCC 1.5162 / HZ254) TaxID=1041930 RepID=H8IA46_METCZ|nr:hypothetical protein [Methanocella conradii]AFC99112.1 hypothetical protein Mtc_0342 [Methanocella conradii HZ254]
MELEDKLGKEVNISVHDLAGWLALASKGGAFYKIYHKKIQADAGFEL